MTGASMRAEKSESARTYFGDPASRGQLAARLQRTLGDQREHDPLDHLSVQAPTGRDPADRRGDPEPLPEAVQRPCPTHPLTRPGGWDEPDLALQAAVEPVEVDGDGDGDGDGDAEPDVKMANSKWPLGAVTCPS